ncbi:MAG: tetratricopeptide repeat protein [Planctomycetota bacterium]
MRRNWIAAALIVAGILAATLSLRLFRGEGDPSSLAEEGWRAQGSRSQGSLAQRGAGEFAGTQSCRPCHERFYQLWAPSHHGLAMQPFTPEFARAQLTPQESEIGIGEARYRADIERGCVLERGPGLTPAGEREHAIQQVLGGKNVYYFLTPLERGRLQVLPVAFDVRAKEWFDTTASAVRHFADNPDEAIDWREPQLTFNTSCYSCHVSQLATNYDLETDSYQTVWREPGINCETCHGPAGQHVRVCKEAPAGERPADLHIIITKNFTAAQTNSMCAPCHAKMRPLTTSFLPGERFFDHFGLTTLEDPDFYPDGRDLGENYTYTLWLMSPCVQAGELDCMHCHTSSGRYRFRGSEANNACMPCHEPHVRDPEVHTHHRTDGPGGECVACHMPKTTFARMARSDHSMRPPAPAATLAFGSPNACNLCHTDQDAAWADRFVREWRRRDYQAPVLHRAGLIAAARKGEWQRLPEMLDLLASDECDEILAASLVRLLGSCPDERKWANIVTALNHRSPLVRASAAEALGLTPETVSALLVATADEYRFVRVSAAATLAALPRQDLSDRDLESLNRATAEFMAVLSARPDDHSSHYNLGNFNLERGEAERAVSCYETALRLEPRSLPAHVNAAIALNVLGRNDEAERHLRRALAIDPRNVPANLNLGLLLGEMGRGQEAEQVLRTVFEIDPTSAVAAFNVAVLVAEMHLGEAIQWCEKAVRLRPEEPRYAYTLAYYVMQSGDSALAAGLLRDLIERHPVFVDAILLLSDLLEKEGKTGQATALCEEALGRAELGPADRSQLEARYQSLRGRIGGKE